MGWLAAADDDRTDADASVDDRSPYRKHTGTWQRSATGTISCTTFWASADGRRTGLNPAGRMRTSDTSDSSNTFCSIVFVTASGGWSLPKTAIRPSCRHPIT